MLFNIVQDAVVITRSKGVFHQRKVYERKGFLYTNHGSGFIRLMKSGTGMSNISVEEFDLGFEPCFNNFGYMMKPE